MADKTTTTRIILDRSGPFAPWQRQLLRHGRGTWAILADQAATDVRQLPESVTDYLKRMHCKRNRITLRSDAVVDTADLQDQCDYFQGLGAAFCFDTIGRNLQVDFHARRASGDGGSYDRASQRARQPYR